MNKIVPILGLFLLGMLPLLHAQNAARAQVVIPQGTEFARGQVHQLQIMVAGLNGSADYLRSKTIEINSVQGILDFNMIMDDNNVDGHLDVRFSADTKDEFVNMLREIFCRLEIRSILVNDTPFENCRQVTIPGTL